MSKRPNNQITWQHLAALVLITILSVSVYLLIGFITYALIKCPAEGGAPQVGSIPTSTLMTCKQGQDLYAVIGLVFGALYGAHRGASLYHKCLMGSIEPTVFIPLLRRWSLFNRFFAKFQGRVLKSFFILISGIVYGFIGLAICNAMWAILLRSALRRLLNSWLNNFNK